MEKVKITLQKSTINRPERQKATIVALGLKKVNQSVVHEKTEQIAGMINKVNHLIEVENL